MIATLDIVYRLKFLSHNVSETGSVSLNVREEISFSDGPTRTICSPSVRLSHFMLETDQVSDKFCLKISILCTVSKISVIIFDNTTFFDLQKILPDLS
jgi:hypothetical protein